MRFTIPALTLAAAASALPSQARTGSTSKGFNLYARVTGGNSELAQAVEGLFVSTAHTGAGQNAAVLSSTSARLFYQNGTADSGTSSIVTDGGSPASIPFSLTVQPADEAHRILEISVGYGTPNFVGTQGTLVNGLGEGTYVACDAVIPYYQQVFTTLQFVYGEPDPATLEACATIELVAKCAELNELPTDGSSLASHEFAADVKCEA
ncbi:hypothetical protein F5144DRAFT_294791 [Chaetomium tenue]|uniref:Uncharacterized protein n=1 Tax=Chaetomium tenue TaxID=1854479 RepID=A0ACB7P2Z8_9PEZI|nr:hypothetical protein F5144DRAFT_294791 [Chaetomium globosum]